MSKSTKKTEEKAEKPRNRERELVITIPRAIWEVLQEDVRADGLEGEHGANQRVLLKWIADHLRNRGKLGKGPQAPVQIPVAPASFDDIPFGFTDD